MKCSLWFAVAVSLVLSLNPVGQAQEEKGGWKPLFDGKTLAGWHKVGEGEWAVKDGAIVGTANKTKLYGLLESDAVFRDFTVRFKFRCFSGDSGFYIRTEVEPPEKARGLQVQVGLPGSGTGGIYESYGRAWIDKLPADEEKKLYKPEGEWNEMVIDAHGGNVVVHVNGTKTAELKNDPSRPEGHFLLQMHSGCVMHVEFKDIEVRQDKEAAKPAKN